MAAVAEMVATVVKVEMEETEETEAAALARAVAAPMAMVVTALVRVKEVKLKNQAVIRKMKSAALLLLPLL